MRTILRATSIAAVTTLLATVAPLAATQAADATTTGMHPALASQTLAGNIPSARVALRHAQRVLAGQVAAPDLTLALRDVALRLHEYHGHALAIANQLLARPNGGHTRLEDSIGATWPKNSEAEPESPDCNVDHSICVHWTETGRNAPPTKDANTNHIPDQVETTLAQMQDVWDTEIDTFGYRAPLKDTRGSIDAGGGFDVYLSDIGRKGYYGYCAIDDSRAYPSYRFYDRSAYCVLDDDFSKSQFPSNTPLENLQVTAAHEFFHAVQFSYDAFEDQWFMEGSAAWIEDEVFDDVNDNLQYLYSGQMTHPSQSLDLNHLFPAYSTWGFLRYLSEHYSRSVIRQAWGRADGSKTGPDDYSLLAVRHALAKRGANFHTVFGEYAKALLVPSQFYEEGTTYPRPSIGATTLGAHKPHTKWLSNKLNHLTMAYHAVAPSRSVGSHARVRIKVNGPAAATDPQARVLVQYGDGSVASRAVHLDRHGDGAVTVDFARGDVARVTAVLINASDRLRHCYQGGSSYSCLGGVPTDQHEPFAVSFTIA